MNRRSFLKHFGIGLAAAAVVAPMLAQKKSEEPKYIAGVDPATRKDSVGIVKYMADGSNEYVMYTGHKGFEQFNQAMEEYAKHYYK